MRPTIWVDDIPCTERRFYGAMGTETYIYTNAETGKVVGGEVIDGEWTWLAAEDAKEVLAHLEVSA